MTTTRTPVDNGVNVEALLGAREALTEAPEAAPLKWRATCEWQHGTHSRSVVEGFFGLGEEQHPHHPCGIARFGRAQRDPILGQFEPMTATLDRSAAPMQPKSRFRSQVTP